MIHKHSKIKSQVESLDFHPAQTCRTKFISTHQSFISSAGQFSKMLFAHMRLLIINWQVFSSLPHNVWPLKMN